MTSSYTRSQIDDANLAYHYSRHQDQQGREYYALKAGRGLVGFPSTFWASERRVTPNAPQPSTINTAQQSNFGQQQYSANAVSDYRQKAVSFFRVVAHTEGAVAPGASVSQNHWTIYLVLSPGGSVQINMRTNLTPGVNRGDLQIKEQSYTESNSAVTWFDFQAAPNVLMDYIEREIYSQGWDRYDMTESGVGCRWWILCVMRGFAKKNYVDKNMIESQLAPALQYNYSRNLQPIPLEMKRGNFL